MVELIEIVVKIAIITGGVLTAVAYLVLLERRMAAWVQDRHGPNRVGIPFTKWRIWGLGQPIADGAKFLLKEEYTPTHVDRVLYTIAPVVMLASAIAVMAVVPFGGSLVLWEGMKPIPLIVAPGTDVALIYIFALSGLAVYGVIIGGWASNNKYSFLGGLRASAQLIAYEIPLGLAILGVVLLSGSLNLETIINTQASSGVWNFFLQPLGFLVFMIASMAEAARLPFDLPECEQELVGGYHTEYTGMKLAAFLMSEFVHMITAAFLLVMLFMGGWHFWYLTGGGDENVGLFGFLLRLGVLIFKTMAVILLFMMIRWSWPRFRYGQLMDMAWKVMIPLGMLNLFVIAVGNELQHCPTVKGFFGDSLGFVLMVITWVITIGSLVVAGLMSAGTGDAKKPPVPGSLH